MRQYANIPAASRVYDVLYVDPRTMDPFYLIPARTSLVNLQVQVFCRTVVSKSTPEQPIIHAVPEDRDAQPYPCPP